VGSVFQDARSQFFTSHVLDELAFTSENYGHHPEIIKTRIDEVTKENQITYLKNRKLGKLSSGEKQKVAMSVIQVSNPDIYVLDEPSANLDYESCLILAELLKNLKAQGKTILIADHRIYYLMDIIDRIVYMDEGMIKHQWQQKEFALLSQDYLTSLGIRKSVAITLDELTNKTNTAIENNKNVSQTLELNNLAVGYGRQHHSLMRDITLTIDRGQTVVLTGKNGIGKTTLAQTLCGLLKEKS
jgi:energy-coupling factor transport system ATP-binding protein